VRVSPAILERTEQTTDSLGFRYFARRTPNRGDVRRLKFSRVTPSGEFKLRVRASTADPRMFWPPLATGTNEAVPRAGIERVSLEDLGEAGYLVLRPVPVEIRRVDLGDFEASFRAANIAISGTDRDDAYQALVAEILDTFDVLLREESLGPDAAEQRRILLTYIGQA
jgi:hypothetical protein